MIIDLSNVNYTLEKKTTLDSEREDIMPIKDTTYTLTLHSLRFRSFASTLESILWHASIIAINNKLYSVYNAIKNTDNVIFEVEEYGDRHPFLIECHPIEVIDGLHVFYIEPTNDDLIIDLKDAMRFKTLYEFEIFDCIYLLACNCKDVLTPTFFNVLEIHCDIDKIGYLYRVDMDTLRLTEFSHIIHEGVLYSIDGINHINGLIELTEVFNFNKICDNYVNIK